MDSLSNVNPDANDSSAALAGQIDPARLPRHIAIIMDGNGRWAKQQGFVERIRGHEAAVTAVRESVRGCGELGVKALTLFAFSTENWNRPAAEVNALMALLKRFLASEVPELHKKNVKLAYSGDVSGLPEGTQKVLYESCETLSRNTGLILNLALNYGGRQEIVHAVRAVARDVAAGLLQPDTIDIEDINARLFHPELGDPDLLIRTSGELRISNFLLWQIAYTEIVVLPTLWPDFRKKHLFESIIQFQRRERRYGGIG